MLTTCCELRPARLVRAFVLAAIGLICALSLTIQPASAAPDVVAFDYGYEQGAVVVINEERKLYYVLGQGRALRYPVAIGVRDEIWVGKLPVTYKTEWPSWTHPTTRRHIPGGPGNPLGDRALYLGWTLWRIHGTPQSWSIGRSASNGCIRMHNKDVRDLYDRVHVGAPVYVINSRDDAGGDVPKTGKLYASN